MSKAYKTLADVLEEQERGERIGKKKVVIVNNTMSIMKSERKNVREPRSKKPKNIFYLQALNIAFDHMDYRTAKRFVNTMDKDQLKNFVEDWNLGIDNQNLMCYN